VTLDDLEPPVVSAFEPSGPREWWLADGPGQLAFSATDNTGVQERRIVEGGVVRASQMAPGAAAGGCWGGTGVAFTYVDPCAGARGVNGRRVVSLDPCSWGPGTHQLKAVAFDVDRASTASAPLDVKIDCTAPAVTIDAGATTRTAGDALSPTVQASDATSGLSSTAVHVSVDGGPWQSATGATTVRADAAYRFRARAVDVAGNVSAWKESGTVLGVPAPPLRVDVPSTPAPPSPPAVRLDPKAASDTPVRATPDRMTVDPETPLAGPIVTRSPAPSRPVSPALRVQRVRSKGRTVTVTGAVARAFGGPVEIELAVRVGGATKTIRRRATARDGRWTARVVLPRGRRVRAREIRVRTSATPAHTAAVARLRVG
jgi:hypothetical protein